MSDPLRTDPSRALDAASAADRDAKIEQLLLAGLDHYFAGRYSDAINIWTRALFLDRTHPRARAYIDRARSALAERQRRSEQMLHDGAAAFDRGDGDTARRLLRAAIDGGAPQDEALALLGRLDRLDAPRGDVRGSFSRLPAGDAPAGGIQAEPVPRRGRTAAMMLGIAAVVVAIAASAWWMRLAPVEAVAAPPIAPAALPAPPTRAEMALDRGRALAAGGHLHDALAALAAVPAADPQKAEADRLRADIQRQLLGLASGDPATPPAGARRP